MTPDPFREALDNLVWAASMLQGSASPLLLRARAEVERLYAARVGVEGYCSGVEHDGEESDGVTFRLLVGHGFDPGDRVYVTKGEAG